VVFSFSAPRISVVIPSQFFLVFGWLAGVGVGVVADTARA